MRDYIVLRARLGSQPLKVLDFRRFENSPYSLDYFLSRFGLKESPVDVGVF